MRRACGPRARRPRRRRLMWACYLPQALQVIGSQGRIGLGGGRCAAAMHQPTGREAGEYRIPHHRRNALMPCHGHRLRQRHVLFARLGDEAGAQRVRAEAALDARQRTALLDDVAHGRRGERLAQMAPLADAPEDGSLLDAVRLEHREPFGHGRCGAAYQRLHVLGPQLPALVGLGVGEGVDEGFGVHPLQVFQGGGGHLGAATPAGGPGEEEQGAVALAAQGLVTGCQQELQRVLGERALALGPRPALGVGAAGAREELAHQGVCTGVRELLAAGHAGCGAAWAARARGGRRGARRPGGPRVGHLMRLGQHRDAAHERVERRRASRVLWTSATSAGRCPAATRSPGRLGSPIRFARGRCSARCAGRHARRARPQPNRTRPHRPRDACA